MRTPIPDCPHCGSPLAVPAYVEAQMTRFLCAVTTKTECCGRGVRLEPTLTVAITKADPKATRDSFNLPLVRG